MPLYIWVYLNINMIKLTYTAYQHCFSLILSEFDKMHTMFATENQLDVFPEATGVVVHGGASVAEGLQEGVDLQDLLLELRVAPTQLDQLFDDQLGALSLACSTLATKETNIERTKVVL